MINDNSNNNNIYYLYQKIFNNKFIKSYIYNYVYKLNKFKTQELKTFTQCANFEQSNFSWLIRNQQYELLFYKIQIGIELKGNYFNIENLELFIQFFESDESKKLINYNDNLLIKFYKTNSNQLLSSNYLLHSVFSISFLNVLIICGSIELLKFVWYSLNEDQDKNKSNGYSKLIEKSLNDEPLLEFALEYGNLNIIKFVHKEMGFKIKDQNKAIFNSIKSQNRSMVLEYLLDEINIQIDPINNLEIGELINDFYFLNCILKLEFKIFKRISKLIPNSTSDASIQEKSYYMIEYFSDAYKTIPFCKLLDFIQCFFLFHSIVDKDKTTISKVIKKLNYLIDYNNNKNHKNNIVQTIDDSIDDNSIFGNWISYFVSSSKYESINFQNFDFEREVKRIYIFDYLKQIRDNNTRVLKVYFEMKINFIKIYGEYQLMEKEFEKNLIVEKNGLNLLNKSFLKSFISVPCFYGDSILLEVMVGILIKNKGYVDGRDVPESSWFQNSNLVELNENIPLQIKNLSILHKCLELNVFNVLPKLLERLFNNIQIQQQKQPSTQQLEYHLEEIAVILKSPPNLKIIGDVLTCDFKIFKYYFENHKNLFYFDLPVICKSVVTKNGSLEFIQYLYDNKFNYLEKTFSVGNFKDLKVAKFMHDVLNFKFSKSVLELLSHSTTSWTRLYFNYMDTNLFYFLIEKLVSYTKIDQSFIIEIPIDIFLNFKKGDYIISIVENGILNRNNFIILKDKKPQNNLNLENFKLGYNINQVIDNGNFEDLKLFFKNLKIYNKNNLENQITNSNLSSPYNTVLNEESQKKISKVDQTFPLFNYIIKKYKKGIISKSTNLNDLFDSI